MNDETETFDTEPPTGATTERELPRENPVLRTLTHEDPPGKEETSAEQVAKAGSVMRLTMPKPRGGAPFWAILPRGMLFPRNKQVVFLRFKSSLTDAPSKGNPMPIDLEGTIEVDAKGEPVLYRQCICWSLNVADQRLAAGRARQDANLFIDELAQQMIRAVDGEPVNLGEATAGGIEEFWNELGGKCRGLLHRVYSQLHVLDREALHDFLENGIAVVSSV